MQVDTDQLRRAAARLRDDVVTRLTKAADLPLPGIAFDQYVTHVPYDEAVRAWAGELSIIRKASLELAAALEQTAEEYDRCDAITAERLTAPR